MCNSQASSLEIYFFNLNITKFATRKNVRFNPLMPGGNKKVTHT